MMITEVLPADRHAVAKAAALLKKGELAVIPTETVYGLAANAMDEEAVGRIFAAKGRPQDNPLIVHIASIDMLTPLTKEIPEAARLLADAFWPGPLTLVLPKSGIVPGAVTAGLDTVAVRMPSHPVALDVIRVSGLALAAPSANRSGRPSPTTAEHCLADLKGRVQLILDGGPCEVGVESTVLSLAGKVPKILRPGAVTPDDIKAVLGEVEIDPAVYERLADNASAESPGMKYKHYSPKASVIVLEGGWPECRAFLSCVESGIWGLVFEEELADCPIPALSLGPKDAPDVHARRLFAALRELDEKGAGVVYARAPGQNGAHLAVYNRLIRAAGFEVERV